MPTPHLELVTEQLADRQRWWRIADPSWTDPVDAGYAAVGGGRWNPPGSWPTLYLNEDIVTARLNLQLFTSAWPYEPEDLRPEHAPTLAAVTLPRRQHVVDVHSPSGVTAAGLPATYPLDRLGNLVPHPVCHTVGQRAHADGRRGIRCRSATSPLGEGRELAWYPATSRSRATVIETLEFADWYWR
ncbi:MAG: RES family NAD+ phosphorylase [Acidimicrobiales bacterium]